ncbi:hypothetical protein [Piscinibacter sp.]|uniref:hypothetical protein n=1 Tax=Piscinibacter sp. TaxID=1903157 RepID=UPI002B9779F2|nr:hypothetical protein [Albitalea sp.]HUG26218.1 hypothetical protein [Albitalea sp.]
MPNPGKPQSIKVITGSRRLRDKAMPAVLPTIEAVPAAPDWLPNAQALAEWQRLAPILVANRLLSEATLSVLGHACALHGRIVQAMAAGQQPKAAVIGAYRALLNDFGLTPAFAAKVSRGHEGKGANRFAGNGTKPGTHA